MNTIALSNSEITIIVDALHGRMKNFPVDDESYIKTNDVLSSFTKVGHIIKPKNRSWVIGCINEYFITPNKELLEITDYEAIMASDDILDKMKNIDQALGLINKLQTKSEPQRKLFQEKYSKLSELGKLEKILYSESTDVNLYKIGLLFTNGKGLSYNNETTSIENIIVKKIAINDYEAQLMPVQFMGKLDAKSKGEDLGPVLLQVKSLIQKFS